MSKTTVIAALAALTLLVVLISTPQQENTDAFQEWKAQYGVNWAPEQEAYRRLIFIKNYQAIEKHNANPHNTYQMGVNQFTVYSEEEFVNLFLGAIPPSDEVVVDSEDYQVPSNDIDWTTKGGVSRVKNQGQCGSCWAFSATGAIESWGKVKKSANWDLSEQQLVDCSKDNHGCNGGWPSRALNYVKTNGIATQSEYPYAGKDQACKKQGGSTKIGGYSSASGCPGLTSGINGQPISVTVDASKWSSYRSGVFNTCGTSINHAVLLVGVVGGSWKIKNSWGTSWGENGFIRLASGNTCGVCAQPGVIPN